MDIHLTNGFTAIIDDCDYPLVSQYRWNCVKSRNYYYARTSVKGKTVIMHRLILNVTDSDTFVDHINMNGLDNRRCNIRTCSRVENGRHRRIQKSKTGFKGVDKQGNAYRATIVVNGNRVRLGRFPTAREAAAAYDYAAMSLFGDFAIINFPG